MNTYIIGDIHGCSEAFRLLLERLSPDAGSDRLILLGDLFDRGPDSWQVFQMVKKLAKEFGDRFVLLKGNHEDYLTREKLSLGERFVWERVGRSATVRSFKQHGERQEAAIPWLNDHMQFYFKGEGFQCVHAGIMVDPPEANDSYTLLHDHDIVLRNIYKGPLTITGHIALEEAAYFAGDEGPAAILPEDTKIPLPSAGVICIDTGCGKGGKLSGMVIKGNSCTLYSVPQ